MLVFKGFNDAINPIHPAIAAQIFKCPLVALFSLQSQPVVGGEVVVWYAVNVSEAQLVRLCFFAGGKGE